MGTKRTRGVLKSVFQDITNISNVIEDSKQVAISLEEVNFEDQDETDKIVENTKVLISRLKEGIITISDYFDKHYTVWQSSVKEKQNGVVDNDLPDTGRTEGVPVNNIQTESATESSNEIESTNEGSKEAGPSETLNGANESDHESPNINETEELNITESENTILNESEQIVEETNQAPNVTESDVSASDKAALAERVESDEVTDVINNDENTGNNSESAKDTNENATIENSNKDTNSEAEVNPDVDVVANQDEAQPEVIKNDTKVFLKLIDISKLKAVPKTGADDSVLIISDSESEHNEKTTQKSNKSKVFNTRRGRSKNASITGYKLTVDDVIQKIGEQVTVSKVTNNPTVDCNNHMEKQIANKVDENSDNARTKSPSNNSVKVVLKKQDVVKQKATKDLLKSADVCISDSSSSEHENTRLRKRPHRTGSTIPKSTQKEMLLLDAQSDKKFSYKAYVPLPRYKCEKLKKLYLKKLENSDIRSLLGSAIKANCQHQNARLTMPGNFECSMFGTFIMYNNSNAQDLCLNLLSETGRVTWTKMFTNILQAAYSNNLLHMHKLTRFFKHHFLLTMHTKCKNITQQSLAWWKNRISVDLEALREMDTAARITRLYCSIAPGPNYDFLLLELTNLRNLKKRTRKDSKGSDSTCSDRGKKKMKRKRRSSRNSQSSQSNKSDIDTADVVLDDDLSDKELASNPAKILLSNVGSATDVSSDDNKKRKEKKLKKSEKKKTTTDDDSSKDEKKKKSSSDSSDSDKRKKSKWRSDKLLRKKAATSDSEDEDKWEKFKKQREKAKSDIKKSLIKKKHKKVIDSDSDSDAAKKKNKKQSATSASASSSSSESGSSDDSDRKESAKNKKKNRRIKRVKNSSSDEDKSTRKTIRRVLGEESLQETTKRAEKEEIERKARIAERQKRYNAIFDKDKPADASVDKVVLDFDQSSKKELLTVDKELATKLKPHQAKGIQFMWDACFESLEMTKKSNGSGCILAHCMGLGKTLQVITLIHTLIGNSEITKVENVLVVCPVNTVLNWVDEFKKWLDDIDGTDIEVLELVSHKQIRYREYTVKRWTKHGGVLIIGYDMFRNLTNPTNKRIRKQTRDVFHKGMVDPGPDMIVCDEGHLLKNEKTHLSVAISRVRTERRIVLTGTPMQNNLKEYYCMVQFVKPNLLGTYKEYLNRFVNPITNGQYTDSTPHDISIMKKRSHVLHKMLDGIVQRKDYDVLAPFLPPKYEYVLFTRLSDMQIKLYQHYMDNFARRPVESKLRKTAFLFSDFQEFQRICTHPRVLLLKSIENKKKSIFQDISEDSEGSLREFIDDDADSSSSSSSSRSDDSEDSIGIKENTVKNDPKKAGKRMTRTAAAAAGVEVTDIMDDEGSEGDSGWWRQFVDGDELENIALGGKLYILFEILQQCELIGDKILIFSQSLYSLNIIEYFLHKIDSATQDGTNESVCGFSGSWAAGLDYFRIDGSSSCDNRAAWCKSFNNTRNSRARLFLISTRAGGLGINLVGANRVIIFDVSWNPSHDTQSIYRVYRFGQTKPCYIYRFVTWGTMEMKIYERQVTKQAISKRVIDEQQIDRHYNQNDLAELYNFDPNPEEASTPLLPKDILLAELLQKEKDRIYKYHEHQTLLENKQGEELDEEERKAAWEEYEHEKSNPTPAVSVNNLAGAGWIKNLPLSSVTAALLSIVQKDNPTWTREQVQAVVPIVVQQLRDQVDAGEMMLFNRTIGELRLMQVQQQQKLQQYYLQQQMRMLQQQQQLSVSGRKQNAKPGVPMFGSLLQNTLTSAPKPNALNSNEIVDLND